MNYIKITLGIFLVLSASRFLPHPPNFTSLIALSFYVPILFGLKFLPVLILCFAFTDFVIGFHSVVLFTWGSVVFISLMSKYFNKGIIYRACGTLTGCFVFFVTTNFGVWSLGSYGYSFQGLIECYFLAIPFFAYTIISTMIYSFIIEILCKYFKVKNISFAQKTF